MKLVKENRYLEILIDYGIIGVIIIFIYISFLLKKIKIIKKYGDKEIIIYISLLTISFILSLLSFLMWQSFLMNLVAIILANAIGKAERIKKQKKIIKKSYIRLT